MHRVGVLELVDQHDPPAGPHPGPGRRVLGFQRGGQPAQQVVVPEHALPPLAPVDLGPHRRGEGSRQAAALVRSSPVGASVACGSSITVRANDNAVAWSKIGSVGRRRERADVEVVDHLDDQIVQAFHQLDVGVAVAGDAKAGQHVLAELVGGDDGRGVESGQRAAQPLAPARDLLVGGRRPAAHAPVVAGPGGGRIGKRPFGQHQMPAHPFAQFLTGRPTECHHQQLVQLGRAPRPRTW